MRRYQGSQHSWPIIDDMKSLPDSSAASYNRASNDNETLDIAKVHSVARYLWLWPSPHQRVLMQNIVLLSLSGYELRNTVMRFFLLGNRKTRYVIMLLEYCKRLSTPIKPSRSKSQSFASAAAKDASISAPKGLKKVSFDTSRIDRRPTTQFFGSMRAVACQARPSRAQTDMMVASSTTNSPAPEEIRA